MLTVKDLVEPLVGDLHDEFDQDEGAIVRVDAPRWLIEGRTSVDEVRERLGIDVPEGEYVTLGGFLFDGFGHIAEEGEASPRAAWDLRVFEMEKRRVAKVLAQRSARPGRLGTTPGPSPRGRGATRPAPRADRPSATAR